MIWQMTYTHKLPKLCSATLNKTKCCSDSGFGDDWSYDEKIFAKSSFIIVANYVFFESFSSTTQVILGRNKSTKREEVAIADQWMTLNTPPSVTFCLRATAVNISG